MHVYVRMCTCVSGMRQGPAHSRPQPPPLPHLQLGVSAGVKYSNQVLLQLFLGFLGVNAVEFLGSIAARLPMGSCQALKARCCCISDSITQLH